MKLKFIKALLDILSFTNSSKRRAIKNKVMSILSVILLGASSHNNQNEHLRIT